MLDAGCYRHDYELAWKDHRKYSKSCLNDLASDDLWHLYLSNIIVAALQLNFAMEISSIEEMVEVKLGTWSLQPHDADRSDVETHHRMSINCLGHLSFWWNGLEKCRCRNHRHYGIWEKCQFNVLSYPNKGQDRLVIHWLISGFLKYQSR